MKRYEYPCRYCGSVRASGRAIIAHESSCPEMRHFAEFVITLAELDETPLFYTAPKVIIRLQTDDKRIVHTVAEFQKNRISNADSILTAQSSHRQTKEKEPNG
jgi:hypothetical protein